jgi:hypothetical protein
MVMWIAMNYNLIFSNRGINELGTIKTLGMLLSISFGNLKSAAEHAVNDHGYKEEQIMKFNGQNQFSYLQ